MEMQQYPGEVGGGPAGCRQSNPHHHPGAGPRVTPTQIGPTPTQRHLTHQGRGDPPKLGGGGGGAKQRGGSEWLGKVGVSWGRGLAKGEGVPREAVSLEEGVSLWWVPVVVEGVPSRSPHPAKRVLPHG